MLTLARYAAHALANTTSLLKRVRELKRLSYLLLIAVGVLILLVLTQLGNEPRFSELDAPLWELMLKLLNIVVVGLGSLSSGRCARTGRLGPL